MKNIHRSFRQRANSTGHGQVMIEFALVLPVILFVLLGVMDLARAVYAYGVISNATRTAAHWGSLRPLNPDGTLKMYGPDKDSIESKFYEQTTGLERSRFVVVGIGCSLSDNPYQKGQTPPDPVTNPPGSIGYTKFYCASWNFVTVGTRYDFQPITLFFTVIELKAQSTMTIE